MPLPTAIITSNGKPVPPAYELLHLDVSSEYNRIPYAELGFLDGDAASRNFAVSDGEHFEPGKEIEIKLRYEGEADSEKSVFKGIVLKQHLRLDGDGCSLSVELSDVAVKMTAGRKSAVFENKKDSDIMKTLVTGSGLRAGTIAATKVQHKRSIQYAASDWDFMLSRAEANGLLIAVSAGSVSAVAPALTAAAKHRFEFGIDEIFDFQLEADARHQFGAVESSSWDAKKKQLSKPSKAADFALAQGNLKPAALAKAVGGDKHSLLSGVSLDEGEAQAWADACLVRSRLSMLRGSFRTAGTAKVLLGDMMELKGVGKRFSGKTLVTGLRHQYSEGEWTTSLQFGLSPESFAATAGIVDNKAAGLLPGVNGLQIGIVEKYADDPDKEARVKVKVPAIDGTKGVVWSRLAAPDAGKNRGLFFYPEPGDEVILGFLNDDPRQSVILGAVYGASQAPPFKPADKNPQKGLLTKGGTKLLFDDDKQLLSLSTSDDHTITINEKDKFIEIKDKNKNVIKLSADGILLDSAKDLIVKAKGDVKIQASKGVEIKGAKIDIK